MKTFQEFLNESIQYGSLFRKFIKNNSPAGTTVSVKVNDNMFTVTWKMVQPQDKSKIQDIHDWVKKHVDVEDIDWSFSSKEAVLFFVADKLPSSMASQKV